ncbi:DSBA oxidoreductase [Salinisphaera sp. PC39]|uniref:thiol:disulfide interchange protein DsbA/DsbL n=1 Tax=Salinisphaera sp. PC39 TaxID=1304156 RepID=UPI00333F5C49
MIARRGLLLALLAAVAAPALGQGSFPARFLPGEHYRALDERAPTAAGDSVEVVEFFLYSCPHCRAFEPAFEAWAAEPPAGTTVRRVPVTFGGPGPIYARLFYTAERLGVLDELHGEVFAAIHEDGRRLTNRAAIRAFFVEHGVEGEAFDAAFDSDEVAERVERADALMRAYGVMSVPSLGVNGRYWISGPMAGGQERMLGVAEYLIAQERTAR